MPSSTDFFAGQVPHLLARRQRLDRSAQVAGRQTLNTHSSRNPQDPLLDHNRANNVAGRKVIGVARLAGRDRVGATPLDHGVGPDDLQNIGL